MPDSSLKEEIKVVVRRIVVTSKYRMSQGKKLLFIIHDRPHYPGGPIVNYLRLLPALVNAGYEVHLLSNYHDDFPNTRLLEEKGIYTYQHPYTYTPVLVAWILKKVEEIQPDIFIPDVSTPGCFAGTWVMKAGIPVINTHRGDHDLNWGKAIYFSDPVYEHVLTGIVCVSNFLESSLRKKIGESPILTTVIPSGVPVPVATANHRDQGLKIAYAGRLVGEPKRVRQMLNAFLVLSERYPDISFTIIGDGPEKNDCISLVQNTPYASRFFFTGSLTGDDYKQELLKHQVIVLLSDYEGTSGSLMDGMSCGLVPVCLKYQGCEDLVVDGKTGILVNDRESSFYDAIGLLYNNHEKIAAMSKAARQHIIDNYSIEFALKKWIDFFELCREKAGKREKFVAPSKIKLPEYNQLLLEYWMAPKKENVLIRAIRALKWEAAKRIKHKQS